MPNHCTHLHYDFLAVMSSNYDVAIPYLRLNFMYLYDHFSCSVSLCTKVKLLSYLRQFRQSVNASE